MSSGSAVRIRSRVLLPPDASAFQGLRLLGLRESAAAFATSYEEEEHTPISVVADSLGRQSGRTVFGAFAAEALVGVVAIGRLPGVRARHRAFVRSVYVHPAWRRQGVARLLLVAALEQVDAMPDVVQVRLKVTAGNQAALALYQSLGFVTYGTAPASLRVDGVLHDEFLMARPVPTAATVQISADRG